MKILFSFQTHLTNSTHREQEQDYIIFRVQDTLHGYARIIPKEKLNLNDYVGLSMLLFIKSFNRQRARLQLYITAQIQSPLFGLSCGVVVLPLSHLKVLLERTIDGPT